MPVARSAGTAPPCYARTAMTRSPSIATPEYLDPQRVDALRATLDGVDEIAIDTEFMREDTFFAELCLVQLAVGPQIYLLDPLSDSDPGEAWSVLLDRGWVLHAGRQDLEVVFQVAGALPKSVFDTQVAAGLLGYAPQLGYANLVLELFGIELSKSQTRADWRRRPLSAAMSSYAAADVQFLLDAAGTLRDKLAALGRTRWAEEDSGALLAHELYAVDPSSAIDRLKGVRGLSGRERGAARRLAEWREKRALKRNRPRQWIMKNALLIDIARKGPRNLDELAQIDNLPGAILRRSGDEIVKLLKRARNDDDAYRPPRAPTEAEKRTLKAMQACVADTAEELGITGEILAPRRELSAALRGSRDGRLFTGWRREVVGNRLEAMLD